MPNIIKIQSFIIISSLYYNMLNEIEDGSKYVSTIKIVDISFEFTKYEQGRGSLK
jgi:hypothetical protein